VWGPGSRVGRRELRATLAQARGRGRRARQQWWGLAPGERWFFGGHLAVLTAVRLYLSLTTPWNDDAASYTFFVRHGLLAVSAYYPMPNNHILANTLAWGFYQVHPGFWWSMRLPVLLTSTLATVGLFGVVLGRMRFWPALLAAGGISWVQLGLYQAAMGRGYWLTIGLTAGLFGALLALLRRPAAGGTPQRLAWVSLVGAGLLGSYTVPTFAYALGSAFSWLGVQALWHRRWGLLGRAVVAAGLVGAGAALLYGPVLLVSGWPALLANPFVRPLAAAEFWPQLPTHAWITEGYLLGQRSIGAGLGLLVLGGFGYLLWQRGRGQLPAALARAVREVGLPALWFVAWPYGLLLGQRVLPPERTWLYKSWFMYLLVALVLASWVGQRSARHWLVGLGAGVLVLYGTRAQLVDNRRAQRRLAPDHALYQWLASHPQARPVLIPDDRIWNWQAFEAHVADAHQPWLVDLVALPGVRYAYVITRRATPRPAAAGAVVFEAGDLVVFRYSASAVAGPPVARKNY
jgi:hypothetical protein